MTKNSSFAAITGKANDWTAEQTFSGGVKTDTISEETATNGVDIDSLKVKDQGITNMKDLVIENQGVGADPIISSDSGGQTLDTEGNIRASVSLIADSINENSAGVGINIDGIIVKDEGINFPTNDIRIVSKAANNLSIRNVNDNADNDLNVESLKASNSVQSDVISEFTATNGIVIDGVLVKDSVVAPVQADGAWINCIPIRGDDHVKDPVFDMFNSRIVVNNVGSISIKFAIPLPPILGDLSLFISEVDVFVLDADASNKVTEATLQGVKESDGTVVDIDKDIVAWDTATTLESKLFAADEDISTYQSTFISLLCSTTASHDLIFSWIRAKYYYA